MGVVTISRYTVVSTPDHFISNTQGEWIQRLQGDHYGASLRSMFISRQTVNRNTDRSNQGVSIYAVILRMGGNSQPGPYLGTTSTSPGLTSFIESGTGIGFENVHSALPRRAIQAGFMTVTALIGRQLDSKYERYKPTLDPDF